MNIQKNKLDINIWFALVEIRASKDNNALEGAFGAFVNVAYRAVSIEDLLSKIKLSFKENDFEVYKVNDIESKESIAIDNVENAEKLELLQDIEQEGYDFSWGIYHTFEEE